jgi:hypothetical protein
MQNTTCESRIDDHLQGRIDDLRRLWAAYCNGDEDVADLGTLSEYGLCFDYVAPGTFTDQREGYFRYQLSWGGPSDGFLFFVNPDLSCHRITYWFLDWFDGAHRLLGGEAEALMLDLWQWFRKAGSADAAFATDEGGAS